MKILVTYASIGGNTMMVAQKVDEVLRAAGQTDVSLIDMEQLQPSQLSEYELVFIGTSTWGDGEYNDFSAVFFDKLKAADLDLSKVKFALFGLGETFYEVFCAAVGFMEADLKSKGANIIGEPLKIDGFPDEATFETTSNWVQNILNLE